MKINRPKYLNALKDRMGNGMVKVITGIRRCGKTYLLSALFKEYLFDTGVDESHILEIALDTEEDEALREPSALSQHLQRFMIDDQTYYIFIDEIQYAITDEERRGDKEPRIYNVLNGLLRKSNVDIYVTGSNSKLLSSDVLTQFRGRGDEVRVHPLSFSEFMQAFKGDMYQGWAEYIVFGGMPLTLGMHTDEQKSRYLENLFNETYLKDIIARNKLRKSQELERLTDVLASNIGSLTNPPKLQATFKSALKSPISSNTISSYIDYLEESFLIESAERYDVKGRKYIGSPKKYYFEDVGLRNARTGFRQIEETHIMENIVFNELRTRGFTVDVGVVEQRLMEDGVSTRKQLEVDFVANLGNRRIYIQSAFRLPTVEKERQEKASLRNIDDSFQKLVLVRDVVKPLRDENGILTMSVYDFLLDDQSLDF